MRKLKENILKILLYLSAIFTVGILVFILGFIFIKGYKQSEMCKKLGLSKSTVSERVKNLEKNIKENFVNRTF